MNSAEGSVSRILQQREREYAMSKVRVKMRLSIENLELGEFRLDKLNEGEWTELPRWVADELVGQGMAETDEKPVEAEIFNALSREKMMGPLQLSALPSDFYVRLRRRLEFLKLAVADG
ncbi:MAG: hypothetical protein HY297_01090, partial [Thaumarchaeota archaeon]|nr:hypothetical protein [Nitrososphaerota archaeon]